MGLYIPGMKKPESCDKCPFLIGSRLDGARCKITRTVMGYYNWSNLMEYCPLIEIVLEGKE